VTGLTTAVRVGRPAPVRIVVERYRDSTALIEHGANLGELGSAILATGLVSSELLGEPNAALKAMLTGSSIRLFTPFLSIPEVS
jgi:hypothetical protein